MDIPHVPFELWGFLWSSLPTDGFSNGVGGWAGGETHSPLVGSWSGLPWATATAWLNAWVDTWANPIAAPELLSMVHGWREGLTHWGSFWHLDGWGDNFGTLLAQANKAQRFNQDILADLSRAWNNFIKTGQATALGIGLFIGYMFRVFTSSG